MGRVLLSADELFLEHVHLETIAPHSVRAKLVVAHDPHRAKAHPLVSANRTSVVSSRIYREPMVTTLLKEIAGKDPKRFGAKALPVARCSEIDVHARMAIHWVVLLMVLNSAYDLFPLYLDDEGGIRVYELLSYLRVDVDAAPPAD